MSLTRQVKSKVHELIINAREIYGKDFPMPEISFSNRMTTTAGCYKYRKNNPYRQHELVFSLPIMQMNDIEEFLNDTPCHEVAHMIDKILHGKTGHNPRFYGVMRRLGHENPTRCHSFEVDRRKSPRFEYRCKNCNSIVVLKSGRHNKMQTGKAVYRHLCGEYGMKGRLEFIGEKG